MRVERPSLPATLEFETNPSRILRRARWLAVILLCAAGVHCGSSPTAATGSLVGVSLSTSSVVAGVPVAGTITLASPAPNGGAAITLTSGGTGAIVPATVTVPAGAVTQSFTITTLPATFMTTTITASYGTSSVTVTLTTVASLALQSLVIVPGSVVDGSTPTGTVTLTAGVAAPVAISLASNSPLATVPPSVTIPAGATTATFTIATPGSTSTTATITASYAGTSLTATLSIAAQLALQSLSLLPNAAVGGGMVTGTVTLNVDAPSSGTVVTLASSSSLVTVPASVTVTAGTTSQVFNITTSATTVTTSVTITASAADGSVAAILTLAASQPAPNPSQPSLRRRSQGQSDNPDAALDLAFNSRATSRVRNIRPA